MVINTSLNKHKDIPENLNGEILLETTKDSEGNRTGYLTIKPEHLKWFVDNKTSEELESMGLKQYSAILDEVMASDIIGEQPS